MSRWTDGQTDFMHFMEEITTMWKRTTYRNTIYLKIELRMQQKQYIKQAISGNKSKSTFYTHKFYNIHIRTGI